MLPPIPELHFDDEVHRYQIRRQVAATFHPLRYLSFDLDDEAKQLLFKRPKKANWMVGRFGAILFTVALNSSCLVLLSLTQSRLLNGGIPLRNCWLWEDVKVMGVELRMTDKKKIGGSCDFLIQKRQDIVVLGDLKTVSSIKAVDRHASRQPSSWAAHISIY